MDGTPPNTTTAPPPTRQIRALHDDQTLVVYQAYAPEIAEPALAAGTFVAPFKLERMTWIKPSFLWMMYRCGWATKPGQERVLAVTVTRAGFDAALAASCPSSVGHAGEAAREEWRGRLRLSPVRVQWDPERSLDLEPLPWRAIQVGLSGPAVREYVSEWITGIRDVTPMVREIRGLRAEGRTEEARLHLPRETEYVASEAARVAVGIAGEPGVLGASDGTRDDDGAPRAGARGAEHLG